MNSLILRIISPRSSSSNGSTPLYTIYLFQKMLLSQSLIQKFAITKKGGRGLTSKQEIQLIRNLRG